MCWDLVLSVAWDVSVMSLSSMALADYKGVERMCSRGTNGSVPLMGHHEA